MFFLLTLSWSEHTCLFKLNDARSCSSAQIHRRLTEDWSSSAFGSSKTCLCCGFAPSWPRPFAFKTPGKVVGPRDRTPSLESCEATQQAAGQLLLHWLRQCHPQPFLAALPILGCELPDWGAVWLVRTPLQAWASLAWSQIHL